MYAQVCFPFFINKTFTYKVPIKLHAIITEGDLVDVKFKNKECKGFVVSCSDSVSYKGKINSIKSVDHQTIPDDLWDTIKWMSNYYVTPIGKITQTVLSWAFKNNKIKKIEDTQTTFNNLLDSLKLTKNQQTIYSHVLDNNKKPQFIYGVPGSGKTEIYLKLCNYHLDKKKSCLLLVPEIALSTQIFERFQKYYGENVLLWHSQTTESYRKKTINKLNKEEPCIIIGARSSLFAPLKNLGIIIVDEEHDSSYKEIEKQPCYNARDLSIVRAKFANAVVVLGSATPSMETYYNAFIRNKYDVYQLKERYGNAKLPNVKIIDMNDENQKMLNQDIISSYLHAQIKQRIKNNEQVLILHNRRGFSSIKVCAESDDILRCKDCDVILTYHTSIQKLICHHCNKTYSMSKYSNTNIKYLGYGTEQIESILNEIYPNVNIMRMDADNANSMKKQKEILNKFKNKEFNILLGTQMIAKGLDFSNITLVAVINADLGMYIPDFRSYEKTFQLLYQVIGRSGRSEKLGEAVIQTLQPKNQLIQMSTNYQSKQFYNLNLESRKTLNYPPFKKLIRLLFQSKSVKKCIDSSEKIYHLLKVRFEDYIIGPLPCPIEKLARNNRYHILLKIDINQISDVLTTMHYIQDNKKQLIDKNVKLLIDIDSISVL